MVNEFKNLGNKLNYEDSYLTLIGAIGAIFNFLGRFCLSLLQSKIGFKMTIGIMTFIELTFCVTFQFIYHIRTLYFIWVIILFFTYGGHFVVFTLFFGNK